MIAGSLLAHAALFGMLVRAPPGLSKAAEPGPISVSLYDRPPATATSSPPQRAVPAKPPAPHETKVKATPPQPTDIAPQYVALSASESDLAQRDPDQDPVALSVAAASGAGGTACHLTDWLQAALQADPRVQAALLIIPRPARSISNALMLWDGSWVDVPEAASAGVTAIRAAVTSGVRAAPTACQTQLVQGPELMTLTNGSDTTVVAIGSGEWRWGDLLSPMPGVTMTRVSLEAPKP